MKQLFITKLSIAVLSSIIFSCVSNQLEPEVDCTVSPLTLMAIDVQDANCGDADGAFSVSVSGGKAPYSYTSDLGDGQEGIYTRLAAGTYTVEVTDAQGCAEELPVTVQNLGGVNIDEVIIQDVGCGTIAGRIEVVASGGAEPYVFSLNETSQAENTFSNLDKGTYEITATDDIGCETKQTVQLTSGVSYEQSIKPIIENNCAIGACHNGNQFPDFRSFSIIQDRAERIMIRTSDGGMPKDGKLTQEEIDMIACWVNDGAQAN